MKRLRPQVWLIHLGVNDERAHVKPSEVHANLAAMVNLLVKDCGAQPARIYLAIPSYDYAPGAATILQSYAREIEALIRERGLSRGPDFYAAFAQDKPRWYGQRSRASQRGRHGPHGRALARSRDETTSVSTKRLAQRSSNEERD